VKRRYLAGHQPGDAEPAADTPKPSVRLDQPHAACQPHLAARRRRSSKASRRRSNVRAGIAWLALSLGTSAFVCGGILLGWSLVADRPELWTVGLPVALCGQVGLLVGLIVQLERLWQDHRRARARLEDVGHQIHVLRRTSALLGNSPASPSAAFYAHLAEGAGPQLLLSDLKSQLDLLAVRISELE